MVRYGRFVDGILEIKCFEEQIVPVQTEGGQYTTKILTIEEQIAELSNDWKSIEPLNPAMCRCEEQFYTIVAIPYDAGDQIVYRYEKVKDPRRIKNAIEELKTDLAETDYRVIKCYEASLLDEQLPYDIKELHARREEQRRKINELEALLATCIIKHVEFD